MLSFFLSKVACYLVGITVPGYMSFRALETFDPSDEKQWLTYWVVYALMETVEIFGDWILLWIPLFYELKLCFLIWMILPSTRGAEYLYNTYIWQLLHTYAGKYDPTFRSDHTSPPKLDREALLKAREATLGLLGGKAAEFKAFLSSTSPAKDN